MAKADERIMDLKEVDDARENGIRWLIASGARTRDDAVRMANGFVAEVKHMKNQLKDHLASTPGGGGAQG
jgi:hypothetical protein